MFLHETVHKNPARYGAIFTDIVITRGLDLGVSYSQIFL